MPDMNDWIIPDWPAPSHVKSIFTTRYGGVSNGPNGTYASLNLGAHVNDRPSDVAYNRALLCKHLPGEPRWLKQVHGALPVWIDNSDGLLEGDAALSHQQETVCVIQVADCLPIFLCDTAGIVVGVIHAGWRGLAAGIIEKSVSKMRAGHSNREIMAWLGPAIGPEHFEVGEEVRTIFLDHDQASEPAFSAQHNRPGNKWLANIFLLARQRLAKANVTEVYGGGICTFSDPTRFFSYRRDGETGRMAALIWLEKQ
ncbi:conserved hypothetical protein [Nitrosomonas cryotolerans]|uniref:Purine nucleoside phosphorylase n=1 Tax=Nitrosomonas cryotolerans ATCC 49181 TaxID=1131553 RepID=A0A1N6GJ80_9PROT|nr:conserved hypothetical protein [Nitrosomonas cryotolerans]SIO07579.1 conserved hypothetical protein [Nitrosomonas cryotolerans ATCC 49181]